MGYKSGCYLLIACTAVLLSACTDKTVNPLSKYGTVLEKVIRYENGAFRGFNLGDKMDSVQAKEAAQPTEADVGYLYYEFNLEPAGTFNVTYNFDETGLNEMQSEIFVKNTAQTDSIFNAFKEYFDDHYGESELVKGYTIWSVKSENYGDVKITLIDESASFTADNAPGKISVWIYPEKE